MTMQAPSETAMAERMERIIRKHVGQQGPLLPMLHDVQKEFGWIPEQAMNTIADALGIPAGKVYSTVTFYSLFSTRPTGKYVIRVCESAPCHVAGAEAVMEELQKRLGIVPGQTTKDGLFTLEYASCLGVCGVAPAIMIGDRVHGNLEPGMIADVLAEYK